MFRFLSRRWRLLLILSLAVVTLTIAGFWIRSWWAQREFEATVAMIEGKGGTVKVWTVYADWFEQLNARLGTDYKPALGTRLVAVDLARAEITPTELQRVANLPNLHELYLNCATGINDEALAILRTAPRLKVLELDGTQVTDAGLALLRELPKLTDVHLNDTAVSDAGVNLVRKFVAERDDPNWRFIAIIVSGPSIRNVRPLDLDVNMTPGVAQLHTTGRLHVHQASMNKATVDFHMHTKGGPRLMGYHIGSTTPAQMGDGTWQFDMKHGMVCVPGPPAGTIEVVSKYREAIVIYRLGVIEFDRDEESIYRVAAISPTGLATRQKARPAVRPLP